ncbi:DNA repair protein endonuclease SAE2/CtIP C-terminus-domain-containing protein [Suillus ampliporus]|nr:DNA repair protein endonuclease SAE2/CtIP C-terminus-domain-containing protein [Suillus ampliporus]
MNTLLEKISTMKINKLSSVLQSTNSRPDLHKRRGDMLKLQRNRDVDFQYDDVVKSREERQRVLADECECCRGHYEAIGLLPKVLQPPLWRSPSSTPSKKRRFSFDSLSDCKENREDIERHKKDISRHRHHWYRAKTPPGYWDIGFPDTRDI